MFQLIPTEIKERMAYLERIASEDRVDGTSRLNRLRQIPPDTGKFIAMLFASSPNGTAVEIGTSAGYSALWLSLVCREMNRHLYTFELLDEKIKLAEQTFRNAKVEDIITLVKGDALKNLDSFNNISFCFLDAEKEMFGPCYEKVIPKMVKGGIFVADNATSHYDKLKPFIDKALKDSRVDALIVPIGEGELLCRVL